LVQFCSEFDCHMYRNSQVWHQYVPDKHILILSLYSICPTPLNYQLEPTATVPPTPGLIACANGVLAKGQEGCPYMLNFSSRLNIGRGFSELSNLDQPMSECWLYVLRMPRRLVLPSSSNPCTILHLWVWMGMCKLQRWVLLHSRPHFYTRWLDEHHHITSCELYIIINHSKHDKPYHQCCYTSVSRHRGTNGNWNNYLHRWIGCHGG